MDRLTTQKIKQAADARIVEVIGSYVELKKRGSDWIVICPFHSDTRPSLHVSPTKHCFTCFSCGVTGDAIKFVMMIEGCDYVTALTKIANILHIYIDATELPYKAQKSPKPIIPMSANRKPTQAQEIGSIPCPFLLKSMKQTGRLFEYMFQRIGTADLEEVWQAYCIGATTDGKEVFWSFTAENIIRYGKVMDYDTNGHRRHESGSCFALHPVICKYMKSHGYWAADYNPIFKPILFGGHLIADYPDRPIAIVESEKTALVGACLMPILTWVAVGGKNSLNPEMLAPCKGHSILLFPDVDARDEWETKCQQLRTQGFDIAVMDWWQGIDEVGEKSDIADLLLRDLPVFDKFTDEEWEAQEYEDTPDQEPNTPQAILANMMRRNPAVALLVDKLQLEIVDEKDLRKAS